MPQCPNAPSSPTSTLSSVTIPLGKAFGLEPDAGGLTKDYSQAFTDFC